VIAIIFEVFPAAGRKQDYLDIATGLRTELERSTASSPLSASRA
jgi:hypothetical protein